VKGEGVLEARVGYVCPVGERSVLGFLGGGGGGGVLLLYRVWVGGGGRACLGLAYHGHIVSRVKCIVDSYTMFSAFDVEWFVWVELNVERGSAGLLDRRKD